MKSQKYSHGTNSKFMFLCEVALGCIHPIKLHWQWPVTEKKPLPPNFHSVKTSDSKWEPDPYTTIVFKGSYNWFFTVFSIAFFNKNLFFL